MTSELISQQLILWDGYNLTTRLTSAVLQVSVDALDNTTLGCTNRSNAPGLKSASAQIEGYYDETDYDEALNATLGGVDKVISLCRNGSEGSLAYFLNAMVASYDPIKGSIGELAGFSAGGMSRKHPLCRGKVLMNQTGLDADGTGNGLQLGAVLSTQTLYAALHVLAIDDNAGDTLDVSIESDDSNSFSSATTRITFDQMADIGSQFKSLTGPITDTWYRTNYAIAGTTPAFSALVLLAKRLTFA